MSSISGLNKKYLILFSDSVNLLSDADDHKEEKKQRFLRASVISNLLALECAANILIESLQLPAVIYNKIERMDVFGKLDYYAYSKVGNVIDRSVIHYFNLSSLLKIRNEYVHPKVKKGKYSFEKGIFQFECIKAFQLPHDIRLWTEKHAIALLQAHVNFMEYYLIELCKFTKGKSHTILTVMEEKIARNESDTWTEIPQNEISFILKTLGGIPKYLDLRNNET